MDRWTSELRDRLNATAREAGFAAAGMTRVPSTGEPAAAVDAQRFDAWINAGRAGEMGYLGRRDERGELVRGALHRAMPWARSVVVCAWNYNADGPRSVDVAPGDTGWIARYAWMGRARPDGTLGPTDYHDELLGRLRQVEAALLEQAECLTRCYVDTGPILERDFAAKAGIGWIGKNTCVLNQELGSWLLLAVIITSLPMEESVAELVAADRCGTCARCIDACPTDALLAGRDLAGAREMDATRCISYLTIEKKGAIDEQLHAGIGRNIFGCDICQEVCPWNRKAPTGVSANTRTELVNPPLEWLASMNSAEFKRQFKGSPLERTGRKRLLRNVAIAMGNSGRREFLPYLDRWAEEEGEGVAHAGLRAAANVSRQRIRSATEAKDAQNASASLVGDADRRPQENEGRDASSRGDAAG
ncbi:MAG TPA: tRNA epoxyqueuosine(34) reductase QueG [Acidobacteriaceae bacterium]|nr:tRNA epoxyqueuosine(34) reductase QueG [Acidobacteriaceae bacterium]